MPAPTTDDLDIQDAWDNVPLRDSWPNGLDNHFIIGRLEVVPVEATGRGASGVLLEVAAAEAVHSCRLAAGGLRTHVVEPSEVMLHKAREHMADFGVRLSLVRGIAEALPYPDRTFDRVLIDAAIDHLSSPDVGIREMVRVLKPDGRFVVSYVNYASLSVRLSRALYALHRKLVPSRRDEHRFWDTPVPVEHTFECTYRNMGTLCGPVPRARARRRRFDDVGYARLVTLPESDRRRAGDVAARPPRRRGAADARLRRLRADGVAATARRRAAGQRPPHAVGAGTRWRGGASGAAAARRDHAGDARRSGVPAPRHRGHGVGGGLVVGANDRRPPARRPTVGQPRRHWRSDAGDGACRSGAPVAGGRGGDDEDEAEPPAARSDGGLEIVGHNLARAARLRARAGFRASVSWSDPNSGA
jgi:SAM-dependent methyltransferase